jgi:phosphoribosylcarboxyaminoimidazole (NCAIR) mutase
MPGGIPVATMAIGRGGAKNAALLCVEILALRSSALRRRMTKYRRDMEKQVAQKDKKFQEKGK